MIVIGSDHGGLGPENSIDRSYLGRRGYTDYRCGTDNDASVDYPDFGQKVAEMVADGSAESGS